MPLPSSSPEEQQQSSVPQRRAAELHRDTVKLELWSDAGVVKMQRSISIGESRRAGFPRLGRVPAAAAAVGGAARSERQAQQRQPYESSQQPQATGAGLFGFLLPSSPAAALLSFETKSTAARAPSDRVELRGRALDGGCGGGCFWLG